MVFADQANDANAINGQLVTHEAIPESTVTPFGSQPDKDFLGLTLKPTTVKKNKKTVCTGFTATITLAGAPSGTTTIYRVTGTTKKNARAFWVTYDGVKTNLAYGVDPSVAGTTTLVPLKQPAVVSGKTITFTVLESDFKVAGETIKDFRWLALGAHTRTIVTTPARTVTVPLWDSVIVDEKKVFTLC